MHEMEERLAGLPPEKRAALARLLKSRAGGAVPSATAVPATLPDAGEEFLALDGSSSADPDASKAAYKRFYDGVSAQLNSNVFGQFSFFLNYGYRPDGEPELAAVELPAHYINRNSVKLVLELIGDCPVEGRRVLDVGCGRGGTVHVFQTFFKPAAIRGLDLSTTAIEFCRKAHRRDDTAFVQGDAENLPFEDGSLDIVTNVESSHSYPNLNRFYDEVHRVLAPGGHFLYTDTLSGAHLTTCIAYLHHIGFDLERQRDITRNVILSCDEVAATRVGAFDQRNDQGLMQNFLATPGSDVYRNMQSGAWTYFILKLRKRG
ncbi:MAG TPA: methyltransferase domain-containing protein [Longimicrobium sp.]|nr:methyltransferase domain-containing protein [Longimicrobium sp.]